MQDWISLGFARAHDRRSQLHATGSCYVSMIQSMHQTSGRHPQCYDYRRLWITAREPLRLTFLLGRLPQPVEILNLDKTLVETFRAALMAANIWDMLELDVRTIETSVDPIAQISIEASPLRQYTQAKDYRHQLPVADAAADITAPYPVVCYSLTHVKFELDIDAHEASPEARRHAASGSRDNQTLILELYDILLRRLILQGRLSTGAISVDLTSTAMPLADFAPAVFHLGFWRSVSRRICFMPTVSSIFKRRISEKRSAEKRLGCSSMVETDDEPYPSIALRLWEHVMALPRQRTPALAKCLNLEAVEDLISPGVPLHVVLHGDQEPFDHTLPDFLNVGSELQTLDDESSTDWDDCKLGIDMDYLLAQSHKDCEAMRGLCLVESAHDAQPMVAFESGMMNKHMPTACITSTSAPHNDRHAELADLLYGDYNDYFESCSSEAE